MQETAKESYIKCNDCQTNGDSNSNLKLVEGKTRPVYDRHTGGSKCISLLQGLNNMPNLSPENL